MTWAGVIQPARFLSHTGKILPGVRRLVPVPNPAPEAEVSVEVPAGVQWFLLGLIVSLTTSAAVGNRGTSLRLTVQGVEVWSIPGFYQAAAGTVATVVGLGGVAPVAYADQTSDATVPLPTFNLEPGSIITTGSYGLLAGDQWSMPGLYIEEIYVTDPQLSEIARERADLQRDIDIYEYQQAMQGQGA